jgi:hypothetical protein
MGTEVKDFLDSVAAGNGVGTVKKDWKEDWKEDAKADWLSDWDGYVPTVPTPPATLA